MNHLQEKYETWKAANPQILSLYRRFAMQAMSAGKPFSISLLTERVRWETMVKKTGTFKVNNNYRAYIARDLASEIPDLAQFIETRRVMGEA